MALSERVLRFDDMSLGSGNDWRTGLGLLGRGLDFLIASVQLIFVFYPAVVCCAVR